MGIEDKNLAQIAGEIDAEEKKKNWLRTYSFRY
jgi:hypothetical protein